MSGTIYRVSSAFLRQQRSINLIQQSNYTTKPQMVEGAQGAMKKAAQVAQGAKMFGKKQYDHLTAGKSREEIVGWVFMGIIGTYVFGVVVSKLKGPGFYKERLRKKRNLEPMPKIGEKYIKTNE